MYRSYGSHTRSVFLEGKNWIRMMNTLRFGLWIGIEKTKKDGWNKNAWVCGCVSVLNFQQLVANCLSLFLKVKNVVNTRTLAIFHYNWRTSFRRNIVCAAVYLKKSCACMIATVASHTRCRYCRYLHQFYKWSVRSWRMY